MAGSRISHDKQSAWEMDLCKPGYPVFGGDSTTKDGASWRKGRSSWTPRWIMLISLICILRLPFAASSKTNNKSTDYLGSNSVVLITGVAGFVGSELAMALHRTFHPKKIICVDNMDSMILDQTTEERLSLFEFKRQRAFHVLQTLGNKAHFYRGDFRPSIPEYFDMGEVPLLDFIFRDHPDITHVVHLADAYHRGAGDDMIQAIPRVKEDIKAGMMESLLEQLMKVRDETGRSPHFTYASSYEVYNYWNPTKENPNPPPFREERPITTPSSLRGATKLIDEILARTYSDNYGIYSVGLRLFPVYGPWGLPGTPIFEMAERAVTDPNNPLLTKAEKDELDDVRDYVYIDDAVDAIMSAMQFRPKDNAPVVVNIGTGEGSTLRDVANRMEELIPRDGTDASSSESEQVAASTVAFASTHRAEKILGFKAHVQLAEGIARLLAWHHDRAFPYGGQSSSKSTIAERGIVSCSPYDKECLHGAPVFPCSSECSHEDQCTSSYYDDVLVFTRTLTEECETVMYTVAIDEDLKRIPSGSIAVLPENESFVKQEHCNIAFVSEMSPLVHRLKREGGFSSFSTVVEELLRANGSSKRTPRRVLTHGFWTLVPLPVPSFSTGDDHVLKLLPKLSPGLFFGSRTKQAIYCDPNVVFASVPSLLEEARMQPLLEGVQGGTAMLIARKRQTQSKEHHRSTQNESVQGSAYRMIKIGIINEMEPTPALDSSWMIHRLQNEDSRLLRCDIFGEIVQWDVFNDEESLGFITGLHDMWSRVLVEGQAIEPWWVNENVVTVREDPSLMEGRRRLVEDNFVGAEDEESNQGLGSVGIADRKRVSRKLAGLGNKKAAIGKTTKNPPSSMEVGPGAKGERQTPPSTGVSAYGGAFGGNGKPRKRQGPKAPNGSAGSPLQTPRVADGNRAIKKDRTVVVELDKSISMGDSPDGKSENKDSAFGGDGDQGNAESDPDGSIVDEESKKSAVGNEDDVFDKDQRVDGKVGDKLATKDISSYDTWMGVLSSSSTYYFVRIVTSSEVGAVYLDDYDLAEK